MASLVQERIQIASTHSGTILFRNMEIEKHIDEWMGRLSQPRSELGGHCVCPFAAAAKPKLVLVDVLEEHCFVDLHEQVTVYAERTVVSTFERIDLIARQLNQMHHTHIFLPDHPDRKNFIKGVETGNGLVPLILAQKKQELRIARESLEKTDYYSHWDDKYLTEIKSYGD
jgi:hypothetical protein